MENEKRIKKQSKEKGFVLLRTKDNLIHDKKCKYCNKIAQYYRYDDDYVCKEHLFE